MARGSRRIVFFGNERLSSAKNYDRAPILQTLLDEGYEIEALIIKNNTTQTRAANKLAVLKLAAERNLNVVKVKTASELQTIAAQLTSEAAILASFGKLLGDEVIRQFPLGIINAHPSLLPAYRGPAPIENTILNGDQETGVSLMKIDSGLDAGDIYSQNRLKVDKNETKLGLTIKLGALAADMIAKNLPLILEQQSQPQPQDHSQATYSQAIKATPALQFEQHSADYLQRHLRAFAGCPNNKFMLCGQTVEIIVASAVNCRQLAAPLAYDHAEKLLYARCQQGYLAIKRIHPQNRSEMAASDFVNGFCQGIFRHSGSV